MTRRIRKQIKRACAFDTFARVPVDIITFQFWHRDGLCACNSRKEESFDWNIGTRRKNFFCPFSGVTEQILEKLLKNSILLSFRLHVTCFIQTNHTLFTNIIQSIIIYTNLRYFGHINKAWKLIWKNKFLIHKIDDSPWNNSTIIL